MIRNLAKKIIPSQYHSYFSTFSRNMSRRFWKKTSYSQCGEDLIIDFLIREILKIKDITYLDLGAHHPNFISNTYYFYRQGSHGVLVEPDPFLCKALRRRSRDTVVNAGVGVYSAHESDFYILNHPELNSFSKEWVSREDVKVERVLKIPLISINNLIKVYCKKCPTFISLDIEGLDFEIIKTLDFTAWRPPVICIETLENDNEFKNTKISDFMKSNDYIIYADTYINTIYVDKRLRALWNHN